MSGCSRGFFLVSKLIGWVREMNMSVIIVEIYATFIRCPNPQCLVEVPSSKIFSLICIQKQFKWKMRAQMRQKKARETTGKDKQFVFIK